MPDRPPEAPSLADPREALDDFLGSLLTAPEPESTEPAAPAAEPSPRPSARAVAPPAPRDMEIPSVRPGASVTRFPRSMSPEEATVRGRGEVVPALPARPFAEPQPQALLTGPAPLSQLLLAPAQKILETPSVEPQPAVSVEPAAPVLTANDEGDEAQTTPPPPPADNTPTWVSDSFQCLTFSVAGVTLATPLEKLFGIVEWPGELTELPGYAEWFLGLLPNRGQNVRVIDTAQIIMPDGRVPDSRPVLERVKYVVLIDEGRWGLAADAINQVLVLSADGVRWRGAGGKRPWLAGTAVEQMCAVLDIDNLSAQLAEGLELDD